MSRVRKERRPAAAKGSKGAKPVKRAKVANAARAKRPARGGAARGRTAPRRADLGASVEGFFARQPPHLRAILDALKALVEEAAPDATASLKWGMPFYEIGGERTCALAAFKSHVNLIVAGPPGTFADPGGLLEGEGKTGRHLKLRALDELPRDEVRRWLRAAAEGARGRGAAAARARMHAS